MIIQHRTVSTLASGWAVYINLEFKYNPLCKLVTMALFHPDRSMAPKLVLLPQGRHNCFKVGFTQSKTGFSISDPAELSGRLPRFSPLEDHVLFGSRSSA